MSQSDSTQSHTSLQSSQTEATNLIVLPIAAAQRPRDASERKKNSAPAELPATTSDESTRARARARQHERSTIQDDRCKIMAGWSAKCAREANTLPLRCGDNLIIARANANKCDQTVRSHGRLVI